MYKIVVNDGNQLQNATLQQIQKALDDNHRVCIIFDADSNYSQTRQDIENKSKHKNKVEIFLFPDDTNNGNLETLLSHIAKHKEIIKCFEKYVECIKSQSKEFADNIDKKSKIYAYREASGLEKIIKSSKNTINDQNIFSQYFDFNSFYLQPLNNFIFKP